MIAAMLGCYLACLWLQAGPADALDPNKPLTQDIHPPSAPGSPGNLRFTHLTVADGLSQSDVRAIAQDRQGFMWFGTWLGGLDRYDGYTFKVYKHDDQDPRSLLSDAVRTLYVDRQGVLWVATMGPGLDRYDRDTDSFIHYRHDPNDPSSLPDNVVKSFFEDESGTLWVGTRAGLCRFDRTRGAFFTYRSRRDDPASLSAAHVQGIALDASTGLLWIGTQDSGVKVLDRSTGHFTRYANDPNDPGSLSNDDVGYILQDREGTMWISTSRGLDRFDRKTHKFIRYFSDPKDPHSLSDNFVLDIHEDRAGRFWVATDNGLDLMDRRHGTFTRYVNDPNDPSSLSSNDVNWRALCEDASGGLWIGHKTTGVDRLAGGAERFTTYRHNPQDANSPSSDVITGLAIGSAGALWIGTDAGLDRFDGRTFTHYIASANEPSRLTPGPERSVAQDSRGVVWTATYGGGLDRLDGQRVEHFRNDPANSDSLAIDNINNIVPDAKGGLWIGVHGAGLDYFDGRHFTHFPAKPGNPDGRPDQWGVPLLLDRQGMLWAGTNRWGLARFDIRTREFTTYPMVPNQPGNQAANWIEDVYSDGAGMWVASPTGLFRFDPDDGTFTRHYTEKDGLANNSVVGVLGDVQGNIWVSTIKGLSRFDPRTGTFRNYDMLDGLQGNEFFFRCHARAPDGRLFFGGVNGLSAFYPGKLADNPTPPPVVLTEFELFNKPVKIGGENSPLRQAVNVASSLTLRYDQSVFRFQFAALDFTAPQKNRYAYKLEGFDRDWQYTDATRRFATYTHLDPGDYTFRVRASNNDGVWNEQGVALHIRILPPWWKTWWFRALCAAVFLALLGAAYQLRIRHLHKQFDMTLEVRVGERTRIARDLHDTLLQSFHGLMLRFQAAYNLFPTRPEEARKTLGNAIDEAAEAITESRDAIQGLRSSTVEKNDLALAIRTLGEELAADPTSPNSTASRIGVQGTPRDLHPILRDEVYRIAGEALRNAFKHAHAHEIEVEIRYDERELRLRVRDDGKGIDPKFLSGDGREGHFGLHGMRERAELVGGKLEVWSELDAGTKVELSIPAKIAYAKAPPRRPWFSRKS